jgi:ABC-2 type transport system permease protein
MIRKILAIIRKDLYLTYTDRNLLLILLVTPLALATIIGAAFAGQFNSSTDVPIRDIPVAVVNLDTGSAAQDGFNQGQVFVDALVPPADAAPELLESNPLYALTNAVTLQDADEARAQVNAGTLDAALIIPADFTRQLTLSADNPALGQTTIEVYANAGAAVQGQIIRSIAESIAGQINTGSVTVAATIQALIARAQSDRSFGVQFGLASASGAFQPDFSAAFDPTAAPVLINRQSVTGEPAFFNPLVLFGSAQALFFMIFMALGSVNSTLEEQRNGTLQRIASSPTPRSAILIGKIGGAFVNSVLQVVLLFFFLTLVGSVLQGELTFIWGDHLLLLAAAILAIAFAATGLASVVSSLARTPEQGDIAGSVIAIMFGLFGGAFFAVPDVPVMQALQRLTLNYWGVDAFTRLSQGDTSIGLNLLALLVFGAVTLTIGLSLFNRRLKA